MLSLWMTSKMMAEQKTTHIIIRTTPELKEFCENAASDTGLTLSDWARAVLARAANEGAFAPRKGGRSRESKKKRAR